jgi:hypothetical protein
VHPGQWTDAEFVACSMAARLCAFGLRNVADDQGIFEWKLLDLKMMLFPGDNVDMGELLGELTANNQVCMYEIKGRKYGAIRNFRKYQKPKSPNAIHPITKEISIYVGLSDDISEIDGDEVAPFPNDFPNDTEIVSLMEEGGGNRKKNPPNPPRGTFDDFWAEYPHKVGKGAAQSSHTKALKQADHETIMAGLRRYIASKPHDRPWCNPATWLNQQRWQDEPAPVAGQQRFGRGVG